MKPFRLSDQSNSYDVRFNSTRKVLTIGCKHFRAAHIQESFHKLLVEDSGHHRGFIFSNGKICFKEHSITAEDGKLILEAIRHE